MAEIYFDYNATTPLAPEVFTGMEPFLRRGYANPSSLHAPGKKVRKALTEARIAVAEGLNVAQAEKEIIFTSGGTESNNIAFASALNAYPDKKEIVTTGVEHSSVLKVAKQYEGQGYQVVFVGTNERGELDSNEVLAAVTDNTALVSIMMANNEAGTLFPVHQIGEALKDKDVLYHVDAVQSVGKQKVDVEALQADYLSISAHKFYGPKGIGALYVREGSPYQALSVGGSQERGRRGGTENVPGIVGMGAAFNLFSNHLDQNIEKMKNLRDDFEASIKETIEGVSVNAGQSERLPNTSNLLFKGADGEALLYALDQRGVFASNGSACLSGAREPSHVLKAMGLSDEDANSSIRFSFGKYNTAEEIHESVKLIKEAVEQVREFSLD